MNLDDRLRSLLARRCIAALSTLEPDGSPHLAAVWYALEGDDLLVASSKRTRKARNVAARPKAALMVDLRQTGTERGVTAIGSAQLIEGAESRAINRRVHLRYVRPEAFADPAVGPLFESMEDVTIRLRPERWIAWDMAELDRQVFGGRFAPYFLPLDV